MFMQSRILNKLCKCHDVCLKENGEYFPLKMVFIENVASNVFREVEEGIVMCLERSLDTIVTNKLMRKGKLHGIQIARK